jgi:hypothetical protein
MEQTTSSSRHDLEAKIVKRSWEDEDFRREFTADPAGAFVRYLNVPAESLPKITIHQEEPGSWHIVLPQKPLNASELSEQDLEKVAGGTTMSWGVVASLSISGVSVLSTSIANTVVISKGQGGW